MIYHAKGNMVHILLQLLSEVSIVLFFLIGCQATQYCNKNSGGGSDPVGVALCNDQGIAQVGRPVHFTLTITNYGKKPLVVDLTKPAVDIVINYGDRTLAQWSSQQPPDVNTHHLELKPQESKVFDLIWIPEPQDKYRIYGTTAIVWLDDKFVISAPGDICVEACH